MAARNQRTKRAETPARDAGSLGPVPGVQRDWLLGLILFLGVVLAYLPVWHAGFIWDDDLLITANPCIVGPLGLKEIWTTAAADICPLTITTFWCEHALWGLAPGPYHIVNVYVHGACALVLWRVLRSLRVPGAWLGAALWALHPVQVESVAWVAELKNPESGLFFLLSVLFFLKWLQASDDKASSRTRNYAWSIAFAALALACKTSTVILPVVLGLCAWWREGRWRWRTVTVTIPYFLLSTLAGLYSMWFEKGNVADLDDPQWGLRTWPERFVTAGDAIWFYLEKLLWPHPLITVYPRWPIDAGSWVSYLPVIAAAALLILLWKMRATPWRPGFFVFAYFLVALLPVLGFVDNTIFEYSFVFDHFQYLASIGPLALMGAGLVRCAEINFAGKREVPAALCALLLFSLGLMSWQRSQVYESTETLWTDSLAKNPDCWVGHYNFGNALARDGRLDAAIAHYRAALQLNPALPKVHNNLGIALAQSGRPDQALLEFRQALQLYPAYEDAQKNLELAKAMVPAQGKSAPVK